MKRILLTGATGFVGRHLSEKLADEGYDVVGTSRGGAPSQSTSASVKLVATGDIMRFDAWEELIGGGSIVIHLAGLAHRPKAGVSRSDLYEVNVGVTQRLAVAAAESGAAHFLYLSSIKVNGEGSSSAPYRATDRPAPEDLYGESKLAAEHTLQRALNKTNTRLSIIRAPLIYGPNVGANFLSLIRWVSRGAPLPFRAVRNLRSFVGVWNLNDLILRLLERARASPGVWMVSDGEDLSTPELITRLAAAMGRKPRLFSVPTPTLRVLAAASGRRDQLDRLCGSLRADIGETRDQLAWAPPLSVGEGIERTVAWYLSEAGRGRR